MRPGFILNQIDETNFLKVNKPVYFQEKEKLPKKYLNIQKRKILIDKIKNNKNIMKKYFIKFCKKL